MNDTEAPTDRIGVYPREYDADALPERRAAAWGRILSVIVVAQAFAIMSLAFALAALTPLQKVVPMVVTSNQKGDEIIRVNPVTLDSPTADYISEISLRRYVTDRNSIYGSLARQGESWDNGSPVHLMSSAEVYTEFRKAANPEYQRLRQAQTERSVRIDSVRKLSEGSWQVEWVSTDRPDQNAMAPGQSQGSTQAWISTFGITYEPKNVTYNQRLNNPFGMTVTSVNDARRD